MAAGESAYDVARRQREKAARLERSAELWERGAQGEVEVARALESLPDGWVVLHDLAWPGRPRALQPALLPDAIRAVEILAVVGR